MLNVAVSLTKDKVPFTFLRVVPKLAFLLETAYRISFWKQLTVTARFMRTVFASVTIC